MNIAVCPMSLSSWRKMVAEEAVLGHLKRRVCHNYLATRNKSERSV